MARGACLFCICTHQTMFRLTPEVTQVSQKANTSSIYREGVRKREREGERERE
jgi:hypothetical protein